MCESHSHLLLHWYLKLHACMYEKLWKQLKKNKSLWIFQLECNILYTSKRLTHKHNQRITWCMEHFAKSFVTSRVPYEGPLLSSVIQTASAHHSLRIHRSIAPAKKYISIHFPLHIKLTNKQTPAESIAGYSGLIETV